MKPLLFLSIAAVAHAATPVSDITVPPGFKVELLREAGQREGSWISMALDAEGRIYISPQGSIPESGLAKDSKWGGLWRSTVADGKVTAWEKVPVPVGDSMGMLWAFDSLYVSGNGPEGRGIYRCKDTDGDSLPDTAIMWKRVPGGAGEHGAHALVLSPDKKNIYIVHGNSTGLIDGIAPDSPYRNWGEDDLLPKLKDPTATFFDNIKAPYGYVLRTDEHGKKWELIAGGFRNPYDIDFNADGELFTYDSDMEWDRGLPWYRPTRVLHIVPGGEYGFREGSAKWPAYYPDSLPAVVDVGLGCPTGVKFGTAATGWPEKYRRAFFACDWTYGRILAVHMREKGASYTATNVLKSTTFPKDAESSADVEPFVVGKGMPVTDVEFLKDGSMVFTTGGRGTSAGLYRVSWEGEEVPPLKSRAVAVLNQADLQREMAKAILTRLNTLPPNDPQAAREMQDVAAATLKAADDSERQLGTPEEVKALRAAMPTATVAGKADRDAVRHTATIGGGQTWIQTNKLVENGDAFAAFATILDAGKRDEFLKTPDAVGRPAVIEAWRLKGKTPADSRLALLYALASARGEKPELQEEVFRLLKEFPLKDLPDDLKLLKLRILQLTFARHGRPSLEWQKLGLEKLLASYPAKGERAAELNRELSQLLIWLSQPQLGDENAGAAAGTPPKPSGPPNGASQPSEGKSQPSEGKSQPSEGKSQSSGGTSQPSGGISQSFRGTSEPSGGAAQPSGGEIFGIGGHRSVIGRCISAVEGHISSIRRYSSAIEGRLSSVGRCVSTVGNLRHLRSMPLAEHFMEPPVSQISEILAPAADMLFKDTCAEDSDDDRYTQSAILCQSTAPVSAPRGPAPNPGAAIHAGRKGEPFHSELGQQVIEKTLALMEAAPSQEEQIHYALVLRWAHGWTPQQRERYFRWFHEKGARLSGGNSLAGFIRKIHTEAAGRVPDSEKAALAKWLAPLTSPAAEAVKPRAFVKAWTLADLEPALDALKDRQPDLARGKQLYAEAQCARCHLYKDAGGNVGPDLSAVAQRFQRRDILEAITDPNKVVSDQYALTTLTVIKFGGGEEQVTGLLQEETSGTIRILTDPFAGTSREFYHNVVKKKEKAAVSLMPPALLNTLNAEEVADLLAFMGGR